MAARNSRGDVLPSDPAAGDGGPVEAANLIAETVSELAQLAHRRRLDMLAHILEMAKLEADEFIRRHNGSGRF